MSNKTNMEVKMKKTIVSILAIAICILCFSQIALAKEFSDVPTSHWAYQYINELSEQGIINGYEGGVYKPSGNVTRAEFLKLIVSSSILTRPGYEIITDNLPTLMAKGEKWYSLFVELAKDYNPYTYDDESINEPITRLEVVNILNRFARVDSFYSSKLNSGDQPYDAIVNTFNDTLDLIEEDQIAISNISRVGLMIGYTEGGFKPSNLMTRAEVATIIYRYTQSLGGKR